MKRKRIVIASLLLIAVAAFAPFWREIWLAVAYRSDPEIRLDRDQRPPGYRKRYNWIPGDSVLILDSVCTPCSESRHSACENGWGATPVDWGTHVEEYVLAARTILPSTGNENASVREEPRIDGKRASAFCVCPTCHPERDR